MWHAGSDVMGCRRPTGGVIKYVSSDTSHAEAFPVATPRGRSSSSHGGELQIMVIYRPTGQIIASFLEELDGLLSSFMEDGTPILVFGDFNINLEKPYATDFHSLLASFDLKRLTTTSTHKCR